MRTLLLTAAAIALSWGGGSSMTRADGYTEPPRRAVAVRAKVKPRRVADIRVGSWCWAKMARLHEFERQVRYDGRVSHDEMRIALSLKADLSAICGRVRLSRAPTDFHR